MARSRSTLALSQHFWWTRIGSTDPVRNKIGSSSGKTPWGHKGGGRIAKSIQLVAGCIACNITGESIERGPRYHATAI